MCVYYNVIIYIKSVKNMENIFISKIYKYVINIYVRIDINNE